MNTFVDVNLQIVRRVAYINHILLVCPLRISWNGVVCISEGNHEFCTSS